MTDAPWLVRLMAWLNRPMFGTKVIPPNACVPADEFPEDEFPVLCPDCDYLLRGLPDGPCPECGRPFERGRLLVDQYAREWDHRLWESGLVGRWAGRIAGLVLIVLVLWIGATHLVYWCGTMTQRLFHITAKQIDAWVSVLRVVNELMWWGQCIALAVLLACIAIVARAARRNARKRRRVAEAIIWNTGD